MPAGPLGVAEEAAPVEVPPVGAAITGAFVDPPAPAAGQRNATITSADDDLTEMIGKFARDSSLLRKN
jgi:hypothetical protein